MEENEERFLYLYTCYNKHVILFKLEILINQEKGRHRLQERVATHWESREAESQPGSGASDLQSKQCRSEQEGGLLEGEVFEGGKDK